MTDLTLELETRNASSVKCCVGAWEIRILRVVQIRKAWLVKFQREAKTTEPFEFRLLWFWLAGAEESAVINKIPELLK